MDDLQSPIVIENLCTQQRAEHDGRPHDEPHDMHQGLLKLDCL